MTNGIVKLFNKLKGYGFITTKDGSEVFVHYASIQGNGFKTLAEGDSVGFDIEKGPKGPKAVNVVKIELTPKIPLHKNIKSRRNFILKSFKPVLCR